jgi:hypothetical protein
MSLNIAGSHSGRQHSKKDASERKKKLKEKATYARPPKYNSQSRPAVGGRGRFHMGGLFPSRASGLRGYKGGFE